MPNISLSDMRRISEGFGHSLTVSSAGNGYVARCKCGYSSTRRRNEVIAAGAAVHHLELIIKAWQAAGSPTPRTSPSDTLKLEDNSESRHVALG
jgi:hypothetical protein